MEMNNVKTNKLYVACKEFVDGLLQLHVGDVVYVKRILSRSDMPIEFIIKRSNKHDCRFNWNYYTNPDCLREVETSDCILPLVCADCGSPIDARDVVFADDGTMYHPRCFSHIYATCSSCGHVVARAVAHTVNGDDFCEDCYQHEFTTCEMCGTPVRRSRAYSTEEHSCLCRHCYDSETRSTRIHGYHEGMESGNVTADYGMETLMQTKRRGDNPILGPEVEIDCGGSSDINARKILTAIGKNYVTAMHDGSIDDGFEIVSCPATLEKHMHTINWQKGMELAISLGYQSHTPGTCGLHVHIDRAFFGKTNDVEEKFYVLFRNNLDWIKVFSRRRSYHYCQINGSGDDSGSPDKNRKYETSNIDKVYIKSKIDKGDRYLALNFSRRNTIEFRIFRGTLKYSTFMATLEFVDMFARIVKAKSLEDITSISLVDFVAMARARNYGEFLSYIEERHIIKTESEMV
jgi:hypothetical protein